jgi:hypothetical protein
MWVTTSIGSLINNKGETMKLKNKDQIITCLIDMLSTPIDEEGTWKEDYIHNGWIEALKWVLGLTEEKVYTEGKNTLIVKEKE